MTTASILPFLIGTAFGFCVAYGVTWLDRWLDKSHSEALARRRK